MVDFLLFQTCKNTNISHVHNDIHEVHKSKSASFHHSDRVGKKLVLQPKESSRHNIQIIKNSPQVYPKRIIIW